MVIAYGGYFVTVRELAKSMKKEGFVLSHVMEVGIQSIMLNLPPDSKKVVMPLRFSVRKVESLIHVVLQLFSFFLNFCSWSSPHYSCHKIWLQKMELTSKELISRFKKSNHLDRQDMVS